MSLFTNKDINDLADRSEEEISSQTDSFALPPGGETKILKSFAEIEKQLQGMQENDNRLFLSDGSWSNYELMEYLLNLTGPATVAYTTWSISEVAITRMNDWLDKGQIIELHAVLDRGLQNRKPAIYQQALATIKNLKLSKCHAKVMVITSPLLSFLVIGSANFTKNPRKEAGVITCSQQAAHFALAWIKAVHDDRTN